jgi:insulysin
MPAVTLEEVKGFGRSLFASRYIEAFAGGNLTEAEARAAYHLVEQELPGVRCSLAEVERSRILVMQNAQPLLHVAEAKVKGNSLVWVADLGSRSFDSQAAHDVLVRLVKEPFYSELRTKQQVGERAGDSARVRDSVCVF